MTIRRIFLLTLTAVAFTLAGCAGTAGDLTNTATTATAPADTPDDAPPMIEQPVEETTPPPPPAPQYATLGGVAGYTWDDNVSVSVSTPEAFEPSEYAAFDDAAAYVKLTVTIVNNGTETFDPSMFTSTIQSAGLQGTEVYDGDQALMGGPDTASLLPGKSLTFTVGFGVADPADLIFEVSPSFDHDEQVFVSP